MTALPWSAAWTPADALAPYEPVSDEGREALLMLDAAALLRRERATGVLDVAGREALCERARGLPPGTLTAVWIAARAAR